MVGKGFEFSFHPYKYCRKTLSCERDLQERSKIARILIALRSIKKKQNTGFMDLPCAQKVGHIMIRSS